MLWGQFPLTPAPPVYARGKVNSECDLECVFNPSAILQFV